MGSKISTISRKKKRSTNSSTTKSKKSYNFHENHSIFSHFNSSNPTTIHEEKEIIEKHEYSTPSITHSMFTSGRTFHHVQNSAYWFPNDDEEVDRLTGVRIFF